MIGADEDKALMGITLDAEVLSDRLGFSKPEGDRLVELLSRLKARRTRR